jgi:KR domain/Phosphopantetheine attachment site
MLSSITSIVGNRGQANYAAGNAYQDALARQLVSQGVKAVSTNLGTIKTVGYVAENFERVQKQGEIFTQWAGISEEELHSIIEYHIDPRVNFTAQGLRFQSIAGLMTASAIAKKGVPLPAFMSYPLFKQLHAADLSAASVNEETDFPIQKLLRSCDSLDAAAKHVEEALQHQLSSMMSVPKEEFDPHKPLQAYGVDSLIAVEIRTWISKSMGADVAVFDILGRSSIVDFSAKVASLSSLVHVTRPGTENHVD